ncbi:MAG: DEAD/DEAH box helicase [Pseudomonadota bacterium]
MTDFAVLGLSDQLVGQLSAMGLTKPTPIQTQAIPALLEGRDVMGLAQTGTGKTAAFGLPLVQYLYANPMRNKDKAVRVLILTPTRELANQVTENIKGYAADGYLRIRTVVGGVSINPQCRRLERGADILVATPGRLIDLLERKAVRVDRATHLVLDEADQMLDMGFITPLRQIAKHLSSERQTVLFSATMPKQMATLAAEFLNDPLRIEVAPAGKVADRIEQSVHYVEQNAKMTLLKDLLAEHEGEHAVVFARTKHGAERMAKQLVAAGFPADAIHGNKNQNQRERALRGFREGKTRVLVATDVAARGIDIPAVRYVYNFDLPNVAENYIHRIGRTARAGAAGRAIAFCAPTEIEDLVGIEKLLPEALPVASGTRWPFVKAPKQKRGGGGNRRGPQGAKPGANRARRPRRPRKAA